VPDTVAVKRALARLADPAQAPSDRGNSPRTDDEASHGAATAPDPVSTVERATEALSSIDAAAAFAEDGGLERLALAVERADDDATAERGRRALASFRRLRAAAGGDHFHSGRGTVIRRGELRGDT